MTLEGNAEFLAELHLQEKEAMFILRQLRNWMDRLDRTEYAVDKSNCNKMIKYWCRKADAIYEGKAMNEPIEPRPFKSLMQQLADGELSYKNQDDGNKAAA